MAIIQSITATLLIQVGADEPKPIGTIEIPIEISAGQKPNTGGFSIRGGGITIADGSVPGR